MRISEIFKSIQNKPYYKRIIYFWVLAGFSLIFSLGLGLVSINNLVADLSKGSEEKAIFEKTVKDFSEIAGSLKSVSQDVKALLYEAGSPRFGESKTGGKLNEERRDSLFLEPEKIIKKPNKLPIE